MRLLLYGIQLTIWSSYATVEMLSKRDQVTAKVILFFVFAYLAYGIAEMKIQSKKQAFLVTCSTLAIFLFGYECWMLFVF
ncbi:hypothetical protein FZC66_12175 [Priestia megaterium]|nr:hypothetical protein FZC66_12175 [Priestia megaterium]